MGPQIKTGKYSGKKGKCSVLFVFLSLCNFCIRFDGKIFETWTVHHPIIKEENILNIFQQKHCIFLVLGSFCLHAKMFSHFMMFAVASWLFLILCTFRIDTGNSSPALVTSVVNMLRMAVLGDKP